MTTSLSNQKSTGTTEVYSRLRDMIVMRVIPSGSKIKQEHIAEMLNTSRTPVVNALHKLESGGLVDYIPNQGFYVHKVTVKELLDLFSFRLALDAIVIEDLVHTLTDAQIDELYGLFEPFMHADPIDATAYHLADMRFHSSLIEWCDNELARRVNDTFNILNRSYLAGLIRPPEDTLGEHLAIINAFRKRDLATAKNAAAYHVDCTRQMLAATVSNLRSLGANPADIHLDDLHVLGKSLNITQTFNPSLLRNTQTFMLNDHGDR